MKKPTITINEFNAQAIRVHDELLEFLHIINVETLPLLAANQFNEEQIPPLAAALDVIKAIIARQ